MADSLITESHLDFYRRWHRLAGPYFAWQMAQFRPFLGRRVVDIGCGLGNFAVHLRDRDLYVGLDPDAELLAELKKIHADQNNIDVVQGDITDASICAKLKEKNPDSILCVNVLEHIADDDQAIQNMTAGLAVGGTLCLLVPAMPWLYGSLDRLDGHFRRYTKRSLTKILARHPLKLAELYYLNLVGALGWFVKGRLLRQQRHGDENYRIMNRLIPFLSAVENRFHAPFGLSLVAVLRKL